MDQIQISAELAAKLTGIKKADLIAQLQGENGEQKEDAEKILYDAVLSKFKEQEEEITGKFKDSFPQGVAKQSNAVYKMVKPIFERLEIEATSDNILDGLRELSDKFPEVAGSEKPDPQTLTIDQIKKLPAAQKWLDSELSVKDEKIKEWEQKHNEYVTDVKRNQVLSTAKSRAMSVLDKSNAAWGEDKAAQIDYFFRAVGSDGISLNEQGEPILLDKDGAPLRDEARNHVNFDTWLINNWKRAGYTFHEAPPGSGSAGARRDGNSGGSGKIVISSKEQYETALNEAGNDHKKRAEIMEAWAEHRLKE